MTMYQGFQPGMYQQPAYPTRLPQMQQPMYQQPAAIMQQNPAGAVMPQQAPLAQTVMTLVTSREQAVVAQIPFDGQTYYFANTANGEVYSKRFDNNTGTSPLIVYRREPEDPATAYATIGMVQQLAQAMQAMQEQMQGLQTKGKRTTATKEDDAT